MSKPWIGASRPMPGGAYRNAATALRCDVDAIAAVFEVEAAGRFFRADGSVERRFEPHKMPGATMGWRDSLKIKSSRREAMFADAYARSPNAALRASSWGGPQIMGDNAEAACFVSAKAMVEAMADDAQAHLNAFVALVTAWGLDSAIRAHDWLTFARRYNGSGQPEVYARRMEAAYRRRSGSSSPVTLRVGDRGAAVKRLQKALGVVEDGAFGPRTLEAVEEFQGAHRLPVDGVVGKRTWEALTEDAPVAAPVQETPFDTLIRRAWKWFGGFAGISAVVAEASYHLIPIHKDANGFLHKTILSKNSPGNMSTLTIRLE